MTAARSLASFRRLAFVHRSISFVGAAALLAFVGSIYWVTQTAPREVRGVRRSSMPRDQAAGGSLDYWIGTWDAQVLAEREYPDLGADDREALEWSRTVLGNALGEWIRKPGTRHANVQSPLKLFVPAENERARRFGEAWIDTAGNEWCPTDGQRRDEFWIQTRVRFRGRAVLLGMAFKDDPQDSNRFEFYYLISLDNGAQWRMAAAAYYSRAGALPAH